MNPFEVMQVQVDKSKIIDFTGISSNNLVFIVRPPPPSMEELIFDFKKLTPEQESAFLQVLLDMRYNAQTIVEEEERQSLKKFVLHAQNFVRKAKMDRVSLSIRDIIHTSPCVFEFSDLLFLHIMRTVDIYHFLRFAPAGKMIIDIMPSSSSNIVEFYIEDMMQATNMPAARFKALYNHWQALIVAIAMGYYFRLPGTGEFNRAAFIALMSKYVIR